MERGFSVSTPVAGWYVDSVDPALIRWWDGAAWSDHTRPSAPATSPDAQPSATSATSVPSAPPAPPAAVPASARHAERVPDQPFAASVSSAPYVPPPFAAPPSPALAPVSVANPSSASAPPERFTPTYASPSGSGSMSLSEPVRLVPPAATPVTTTPAVPAVPVVPVVPVVPIAAPTSLSPSPSAPWVLSSTFAQPTSAADLASVDYEPMNRSFGSSRSSSSTRQISGVSTGGGWMLALSPLVLLGLGVLGWWLTDGGASASTALIAGGLGVAAVLLIVVAVIADSRRLTALGHEFRPSLAWILLGPFFYLMARSIHLYRSTRSGVAPLWVFVIVAALVSAAAGALSLLQPGNASLSELRAVESTIVSDMQEQGFEYTVLCPSEASAALGSSFVCTAYDEVGPAAVIRVTWSGVGGAFEYALESMSALGG